MLLRKLDGSYINCAGIKHKRQRHAIYGKSEAVLVCFVLSLTTSVHITCDML